MNKATSAEVSIGSSHSVDELSTVVTGDTCRLAFRSYLTTCRFRPAV